MDLEDKIKEKYGKQSGLKVPDGYFNGLTDRIMAGLPSYVEAAPQPQLSRWHRVRPYVYLAAMFCGIWLMMKVFHHVTDPDTLTLDNPPEALVYLIESESWDGLLESYEEPEFILEEEISGDYDSIEDFERDFGYTLSPEYSSIKTETTESA